MVTTAPKASPNFDEWLLRKDVDSVAEMCRFYMQDDPVHRTLREITSRLTDLSIPYAVAGGMALAAHRFIRATTDVDILVNMQGLTALHSALDGLGYVPPFTGSKNLRDATTGVRIEFLITGQFPGDGKPKPVAFPEPSQAAVDINGIMYLSLPTLIQLKLASGMTNPGRLKDLADVQELIRILELPGSYAEQLDPYVREKFAELLQGVESERSRGE